MNRSIRMRIARQTTPVRGALRRAFLVATLTATCLGGAAVGAEGPPVVRVSYGDLNLSTDAGSRALLRRLSAAAHRVCDDPGTRELRRVVRAEACYRESLDEAVVAVHNERLSALYRAGAGAGAT